MLDDVTDTLGQLDTGDLLKGDLLNVDVNVDLDADLAAPINGAVAANANVAAPIDASVAAIILSENSEATAIAQQDAIITQTITGNADATSDQVSDIDQSSREPVDTDTASADDEDWTAATVTAEPASVPTEDTATVDAPSAPAPAPAPDIVNAEPTSEQSSPEPVDTDTASADDEHEVESRKLYLSGPVTRKEADQIVRDLLDQPEPGTLTARRGGTSAPYAATTREERLTVSRPVGSALSRGRLSLLTGLFEASGPSGGGGKSRSGDDPMGAPSV